MGVKHDISSYKNNILKVFENRLLRRMPGPEEEEIRKRLEKLHE
jgi:hypothetical protein